MILLTKDIGLSELVQNKLNSVFKMHPKIDRVVLYGSRAKGNYKPASDIDLTIMATEMALGELLQIQNEIDDLLLPYKIDLSFYNDLQNENLKDHIERVGKDFYTRG